MKISTTITKAFFEMKMQDLKECGYFIEFKEDKPFWNKRLHNINGNHKALGTEIVFLVGKEPHRFKVVEIRLTHSDYVPLKYVSAISTKFAYAIKCVPLEVKTMKETVYCLNDECGYHIKDEKELDEQTDACGNIVCPNCGGMMAMV